MIECEVDVIAPEINYINCGIQSQFTFSITELEVTLLLHYERNQKQRKIMSPL